MLKIYVENLEFKGNNMQIINENELLDDTVEGLANFLDLEMKEVRTFVTEEIMEEVLNKMFEAQSEVIHNLGLQLKKEFNL